MRYAFEWRDGIPSVALLVYHQYRKKGIGQALMSLAMAISKSKGYDNFNVFMGAEGADFYKSLGFQQLDEESFFFDLKSQPLPKIEIEKGLYEVEGEKGSALDQSNSPVSAVDLVERLKAQGVSPEHVDEPFVTIFNAVHKVNPNVDPYALLKIYQSWSVQSHHYDFYLPTGVVDAVDKTFEVHDRYGGEDYKQIIESDPVIDFLTEEMEIPHVYRHDVSHVTGSGIEPGSPNDSIFVNIEHYYTEHYTSFYTGPAEFDAVIRFVVLAWEGFPLRKILLGGSSDNIQDIIEKNVRFLGKEQVGAHLVHCYKSFLMVT